MKKYIVLILTSLFIQLSIAQNLSRFPYIQATTKTSTIVAWKTDSPSIGEVNFGTDPTNLNQVVLESSASELHGLTLENLQPDTKYYYAISADGTILAEEFFHTASDSTDQAFSFIHYGDCGYNSVMQHQVGALMEADDASFAVVCGDVDQGGVPHVTPGSGGDNYDEIYFDVYNDGTDAKMLSHECHYTSIGNHDTYKDNCATYMEEFFLLNNNPEGSERYYSYEWGDAKFIALDVITPYDDTTFPINSAPLEDRWWTDFRQGSPQYQFLEDELKCNDRKWTFVFFHEGPWTNYWGSDYSIPSALGGDYYQYDGNQMVRDHLVPLFEQYNVDAVLVGHSHLYERAEKNGVLYITSGSAGDGDLSGNNQIATHPEIQLSILDNVYVRYEITENNMIMKTINKDNNIIDNISISKPYTAYDVANNITNASCVQLSDGAATLTVNGPKPPYSVEWFDGTPGNSISGLAPGIHYAIVTDGFGCERVTSVDIGDNMLVPDAEFGFSNLDNTFDFLANDNDENSYLWNYGNGDTETTSTPSTSYEYPALGTYTVTLTIMNDCGSDIFTQTVNVTSFPSGIEELDINAPNAIISPNPSSQISYVETKNINGKLKVKIYNIQGKLMQQFKTRDQIFELNVTDFPVGQYLVKIEGKDDVVVVKELLVVR